MARRLTAGPRHPHQRHTPINGTPPKRKPPDARPGPKPLPHPSRGTRRIQVLSSAAVRKSTERRTWAGRSAMALRPVVTLTMSRYSAA